MAKKNQRGISFSKTLHNVVEFIHPSCVTWAKWKDVKTGSFRAGAVMCLCALLAVGADALIGAVFNLII